VAAHTTQVNWQVGENVSRDGLSCGTKQVGEKLSKVRDKQDSQSTIFGSLGVCMMRSILGWNGLLGGKDTFLDDGLQVICR